MCKHIIRIFLAFMLIIAVAATASAGEKAKWTDANGSEVKTLNLAVGGQAKVTLKAPVPAGKTLSAYSLMIMFDEDALEVSVEGAKDADIETAAINPEQGGIVVNGMDLLGKINLTETSIVDIKVKKLSGDDANITAMFTKFGNSASDQFKPEAAYLNVLSKAK